MPKIGIVVGSTRSGRLRSAGRRVGPRSLGAWAEPGGPEAQVWVRTIDALEGFVFVAPEYNNQLPGPLKNAIDFVYAGWAGEQSRRDRLLRRRRRRPDRGTRAHTKCARRPSPELPPTD
ncbi:NADPH-dependent FMN reductase [Streptomyces sp. NPDC058231]|uniref:NADPH-dependent FMN reductase n=1 Tax=Streptomyces sp. NPDC058231 TaxID=3346392 RepID=UPI0036E57734